MFAPSGQLKQMSYLIKNSTAVQSLKIYPVVEPGSINNFLVMILNADVFYSTIPLKVLLFLSCPCSSARRRGGPLPLSGF